MKDQGRLIADLLGTQRRQPAPDVLIGLVGRGIQASRSPVMHEREAARLGIRARYVLIDFDTLLLPDAALGEVIVAAQQAGFAGVNVTHPFKQAVIPLLSQLDSQAAAIGAVNTIVFRDGSSTGHNTDGWGFAESFRDSMRGCSLRHIVQFGAGGAGAAVAYALLELGAEHLSIVDNHQERARLLADRLLKTFGPRVRAQAPSQEAVSDADGIVNATPVGMTKYPGTPFPEDWLAPRHWVGEVIYFPKETELLRCARSLGCRRLEGTGMAVYQALRAFELFTGLSPSKMSMIDHFESAA